MTCSHQYVSNDQVTDIIWIMKGKTFFHLDLERSRSIKGQKTESRDQCKKEKKAEEC